MTSQSSHFHDKKNQTNGRKRALCFPKYLKDEIVKSVEEKQGNEWYGMKVETLIHFYKQHAKFLCDHHT